MRFIQKWSYSCADYLMKNLNENHQKRGIYYYAFQIIIGAIVKGGIILTSALLVGALLPTIFLIASFSSLRVLAGGYHMDTYGKCLLISLVMMISGGAVAAHTYTMWSDMSVGILVGISFVCAVFVIFKWVPKDTPNKRISQEEKIRKFKRLSLIQISLWLCVVLTLKYFNLDKYVLAGCFGILWEIFTITPVGYNFFDYLNGKLKS